MGIKNEAEVRTYDHEVIEAVFVKSTDSFYSFVEIQVGGEQVKVDGRELQKAIDNCINV